MRRLFIASILFFGLQASAGVSAFFNHTAKEYTFIVQGPQGDLDAPRLFDLLNTNSEDLGSQFRKTVSFTDIDGIQALAVSCTVSKAIENFGSCTIKIKNAFGVQVEDTATRKYLAYDVTDNVNGISNLFKTPQTSAIFYTSSDKKLDLSNAVAPDPRNFALVFLEKKTTN